MSPSDPPGNPGSSGASGDPTSAEASGATRFEVPVDTRAPTGTTNAYLVDGLLVDPAAETDALDAAIGRIGVDAVDAIAVTHSHPDHVGGVATYADRTDAGVYAHADHVDRFRAATGVDPDSTFRDGDLLGSTGVRVLDTPGHAPDHVAFAVEGGATEGGADAPRELLCGDLAVATGSVVVGAPEGDIAAYLESLEGVRDAGYDRLWPGHGPAIDDPENACQRLIDHRLARERRVLEAVGNGATDLDGVLAAAYEKDLSGVEDLARATVRAHLEKLVAEGRVDDSWGERA